MWPKPKISYGEAHPYTPTTLLRSVPETKNFTSSMPFCTKNTIFQMCGRNQKSHMERPIHIHQRHFLDLYQRQKTLQVACPSVPKNTIFQMCVERPMHIPQQQFFRHVPEKKFSTSCVPFFIPTTVYNRGTDDRRKIQLEIPDSDEPSSTATAACQTT